MKAPSYSALALTLLAMLSLGTPSDAEAQVRSFKPVDRSGASLAFRIGRLAPARIVSATVVTGKRRQNVTVGQLRRAISRRLPLRVRVRALAHAGRVSGRASRLRVTLSSVRTSSASLARPDTSITGGPSGTVSDRTATFRFSSTDPSARFECRLDWGAWTTCSSPRFYDRLALGSHHFAVRARGAKGRADRTPATRSWFVADPAAAAPVPQDPPPATTPDPAPAPAPAPAPTPTPTPTPTTLLSLLSADFAGIDGTFASSGAFWGQADNGLTENPDWFAESGTMFRRSAMGWTNSAGFRMWTRRTTLAHTQAEMDVRFNGWSGGTASWHGINLWLNYSLQSGSKVNDGSLGGYAVDFLNRDGNIYIQKKTGVDQYYMLAKLAWKPATGTSYRFGGRVIDNGNGSSTIQLIVNGQVLLQAVDNGSVGGARLLGGRVGVRSDYADMTIDNLAITRK